MRIAFLAVISIILVSGCIGSASVSGGGVVIEAFEPDFPQIYTGETVQFRIKMRNTGTVDATELKMEIFGAEWIEKAEGCNQKPGKLIAASPDKGTQGETFNCYWTLKAEKGLLPEGMIMTYYPIARVTYKYSSTAIKSVTIGTTDELRAIQDRGGALPAEAVSSTSGPVNIAINVKGPIRVSQTGEVTFPVEITFTNSGGGIVSKTESKDGYNYLAYSISADDFSIENCGTGEIYLFRGQSNTITCKFKTKSTLKYGLLQAPIKVHAKDYYYIIDKSSSVTVTGMAAS